MHNQMTDFTKGLPLTFHLSKSNSTLIITGSTYYSGGLIYHLNDFETNWEKIPSGTNVLFEKFMIDIDNADVIQFVRECLLKFGSNCLNGCILVKHEGHYVSGSGGYRIGYHQVGLGKSIRSYLK